MEEKKRDLKKAGRIINTCLELVCTSVGAKVFTEIAKTVMPQATMLTKVGAALIGSGIGEIAIAPMKDRITETIVAIEEGFSDDAKEDSVEETTEEVVTE